MEIVNMDKLSEPQLMQAALILAEELPIGWPTLSQATDEVNKLLARDDGTVLIAAIDDGEVTGWCGILPEYNGNVYELHPLVVSRKKQRKGIGTKLVETVSEIAREKGGLTLQLGSDDEKPGGETSFANVDLYDDLPRRIKEFETETHPAAFYLKIGFKIVGVVPDANGKGKPDIMFAKPLQSL